ncbi:Mitotic inducer phosphatase Cdc25 [Taphrina deformans PYCC 5710]|uniref:M-phase inducer phosphatase n=1 Tax=Taphrina deformans (strain PYCC 5710 / ATCC 11124 / CBS 356.35 / IMI 108563 / JCM 9778 / NBRC 8474) TaxID=1097556 RepID=R4XC12_TAPDE|nr:Mitotic inducer phosphatase Cdc25 [Taphrina deformans PYCC 5710]|eukprot:CCG83412.1 Mitotic inducer phosphatase Cdc25 [Taphrina deformans PYCC 5710]
MSRAGASYFDLKPQASRASPTAALVADLSQNFHLGASPAVPTPRRSLMAQFSLKGEDIEPYGNDTPITPYEDLQSSPGDIMDTSPLPMACRRPMVRSTSMFEPEHRMSNPSTHPPISRFQRPQLVSRKAFTEFAVPAVPDRLAPIRSTLVNKENDGLADQFEESPRKTPQKFFNFGIGRKVHEAFSPTVEDPSERSPLQPLSSNFSKRRLPQFRRTQSMVTKNDDFLAPEINEQHTPRLATKQRNVIMSPGTPDQLPNDCQVLPSFESRADQLRRISGLTLVKVLEGAFKHAYDKLEIIDCRFPHEYAGGHIPNAINISSLDAMDEHPLLIQPQPVRTLIILHCEYSAHRAPRIALHLRNWDRKMNEHRYPELFYPEVYILDGGYSTFFRDHRNHVGNMGYVEMNDPTHKPCASKQMHNFRKNGKFQRTQSYTFGQSLSLTGGESMQREDNFRMFSGTGEEIPARVHSAQGFTQNPLNLQSPPRQGMSVAEDTEDDSFGDCSMMEVDNITMESPIPSYSNSSSNTFQRTHVRTASGRIDPRRLSSF